MPPGMEEIAAVVHRDETVQMVRSASQEREQQRTTEQIEDVPLSPEKSDVARERVQQWTAKQIMRWSHCRVAYSYGGGELVHVNGCNTELPSNM